MTKICAVSDVVITTAQVFGRKAPLIITEEMVRAMPKGSVVVDGAVESGGNVAGSRPDEEVDVDGVLVIGLSNLPGRVALHASQMFSANVFNLIISYWDHRAAAVPDGFDDEIIRGCVITHQGEIVNEMISRHYSG